MFSSVYKFEAISRNPKVIDIRYRISLYFFADYENVFLTNLLNDAINSESVEQSNILSSNISPIIYVSKSKKIHFRFSSKSVFFIVSASSRNLGNFHMNEISVLV